MQEDIKSALLTATCAATPVPNHPPPTAASTSVSDQGPPEGTLAGQKRKVHTESPRESRWSGLSFPQRVTEGCGRPGALLQRPQGRAPPGPGTGPHSRAKQGGDGLLLAIAPGGEGNRPEGEGPDGAAGTLHTSASNTLTSYLPAAAPPPVTWLGRAPCPTQDVSFQPSRRTSR